MKDVKLKECGLTLLVCTYRLTGPGEHSEDGEMKEMTLPARQMIPGSLRPSTLPQGHEGTPQYWIYD